MGSGLCYRGYLDLLRDSIADRTSNVLSRLARASAFAAVFPRCGRLGSGSGFAAGCSELRGHKALRAEHALQERRHIQIGVELRPVQPKAGRADFDFGQVVPGRVGETFRQARRESDLHARIQVDDKTGRAVIIACGYSKAILP